MTRHEQVPERASPKEHAPKGQLDFTKMTGLSLGFQHLSEFRPPGFAESAVHALESTNFGGLEQAGLLLLNSTVFAQDTVLFRAGTGSLSKPRKAVLTDGELLAPECLRRWWGVFGCWEGKKWTFSYLRFNLCDWIYIYINMTNPQNHSTGHFEPSLRLKREQLRHRI